MSLPHGCLVSGERTRKRARGWVWLIVIALVATKVVWMPAHLAFEEHCATETERHGHDEHDHCEDGHQHDPTGEHDCHTEDEHDSVLAVQRGGVELEPAGLAPPAADPQGLQLLAQLRRVIEVRSLTAPESPPPRRRLGRAPPV